MISEKEELMIKSTQKWSKFVIIVSIIAIVVTIPLFIKLGKDLDKFVDQSMDNVEQSKRLALDFSSFLTGEQKQQYKINVQDDYRERANALNIYGTLRQCAMVLVLSWYFLWLSLIYVCLRIRRFAGIIITQLGG